MAIIRYSISDEIFERFPHFVRGVLAAQDVTNIPSPPDLVALLRREETRLRTVLQGQELTAHPNILNWREAFRSAGIKPSEFRSSIEAMARRALNGKELPAINALVDIGNIISLRYMLPAGGHALDHVKDEISLRLARGDETFIPFGLGEEALEHPEPGEIIFCEGSAILTRRWVWRQSSHTLTEIGTRSIGFNLDGLPPVDEEIIRASAHDLETLVCGYCGGQTRLFILSRQNPVIEF